MKKICGKCGAANSENAVVCKDCGASLKLEREEVESPSYGPIEIEGIPGEYYQLYMGLGGYSHVKKWWWMKKEGKRFSLDPLAFLFTYYWLIVKKMWRTALVYLGICLAVHFLIGVVFVRQAVPVVEGLNTTEKVTYSDVVATLEDVYGEDNGLRYWSKLKNGELIISTKAQAHALEVIKQYDHYRALEDQYSFLKTLYVVLMVVFSLVTMLIFGLFGDRYYYRFVRRQITAAMQSHEDEYERRVYIMHLGNPTARNYLSAVGIGLAYRLLITAITVAVVLIAFL